MKMDKTQMMQEIDTLRAVLEKERSLSAAYREALLVILDAIDYTSGACRINEMVGAVLPHTLITKARAALDRGLEEPVGREELAAAIQLAVRRCPTMHEAESHLAEHILKTFRVERR